MKEVLLVTNYFPPEKGAAANRIYFMAEALQKKGYQVTVVTPLPNYPTGKIFPEYKGVVCKTSIENHIKIVRLWMFASNSKNIFLRFLAMCSYSLSLLLFFIAHKIPQKVIIQSPPLIMAHLCIRVLKSKKRKIILNVSDLWPLAGLELGVFKKNFTYKLLEKIERYNYKNATLLLGQSQEIINHIQALVPNKPTILYRNYPPFKEEHPINYQKSSSKLTLVYAGLLGVAQGVLSLCKKLDFSEIELHIYGNGFEKEALIHFIDDHPHLPIYYHGELTRKQLHQDISLYDAAIIPLQKRIYGSVPSKIFEYAFLGIPMLYFGGGEGELIIRKYQLGWVIPVENYNQLNQVISEIKNQPWTFARRREIQQTAQSYFKLEDQIENLTSIL